MNKDISILVLSHKSKNLVTNLIKKLYNKFPIIVVDNSDDLELKRILNKNIQELFIIQLIIMVMVQQLILEVIL